MIYVSDTHISKDLLYGINTIESFKKVVSKLSQFDDPIIFLGDNVQNGSMEEYSIFFDLISSLKNEMYIISGNHDNRENLKKASRSSKVIFMGNDTIEIENTKYIFLESQVENKDYGYISQNTLLHLDNELSKNNNCVICLHHHIVNEDSTMDKYITTNYKDIFKILIKYKENIKYTINGHVHKYSHKSEQDIKIICCPSSLVAFNFTNGNMRTLESNVFLNIRNNKKVNENINQVYC
jgi:Icc protein